jgi:hypothetical protein
MMPAGPVIFQRLARISVELEGSPLALNSRNVSPLVVNRSESLNCSVKASK